MLVLLHGLQRWMLLRNHRIAPEMSRWLKQGTENNLWLMDMGCGEGMYLKRALQIGCNTGRIAKIIGLDANAGWMEFLSQKETAIFPSKSLVSPEIVFKTLDMQADKHALLTSLPSIHRLICISSLQYLNQPLQEFSDWIHALPVGAEFFLYLPVQHQQYTPWYRWLFRQGQNYEAQFHRPEPVGLVAFNEFVTAQKSNNQLKTIQLSYHYHRLAAIGHEQFSTVLMVWNWKTASPWLNFVLRVFAFLLVLPAWIISAVLYYVDRIIAMGKPNSVLWIGKKMG